MKNTQIAYIFDQMADILELQGNLKDRYRVRAYRNAAMTMRDLSQDIQELADQNKLQTLTGIGEATARKIKEFLETGQIKAHLKLKKSVKGTLLELLEIPNIGPKTIKKLNLQLGVENIKDLEKVIKSGQLAQLEGFGPKSSQKILDNLTRRKKSSDKIPLGEAYLMGLNIIAQMKKSRHVKKISLAGSLLRMREQIGDIDILAASKDKEKVIEYFVTLPLVKKIIVRGDTKASVLINTGRQVDLRVVAENQWGSALQYFTGSKEHNVHLRTIAKEKGFKISEYGIFKGKKRVGGQTEESIYQKVGLQYIPPEMRENMGEIEAAQKHKIPKLVQIKDLKGDLHLHSKWSDGRDSMEDMIKAAIQRGYEYIALTDHSKSTRIAHGLDGQRVKKQHQEILKLRKKYPQITIFHGAEVDILSDGSLDHPTEILKLLDWVIGSVHSRFTQDNTARILKAMENPYVHVIGHPTGRLIGQRESYPLDLKAVYQKAVQTNTLLEIDAQYKRLDLRDIHIQQAKKYGAKFVIDSDAHNREALWTVDIGVGLARRAWLTKADIINTLPLKKFREFLGNKRLSC